MYMYLPDSVITNFQLLFRALLICDLKVVDNFKGPNQNARLYQTKTVTGSITEPLRTNKT